MNLILKLFFGMCVIGLLSEVIDNVRTQKLVKEYKHTPEFQKLIDHYREK